ncbi:hypothetical protein [uncultured Sphingomonas sp.]|uniref:hypothetical protein n=1 Tax=uncultured Sphingomonas sp. TaxID=158754 RepID=UPI0035C9ADA7
MSNLAVLFPKQAHSDETILEPHTMTGDWLDPAEVRSLTVEQVLARVEALRPLIADNARKAELLRHPVDEVWAAIRATGIFYLFVPKKYGGMEAGGLQALTDAVVSIGESCTSTAWCTCFSIYHQWTMMQFTEKFQQEIWGELPYFTSAGSGGPTGTATRVEGGFRLSGRWKWASGVMHAEWINTAAMVEEDGRMTPYFFFVPVTDATILDTWYVDGMVGTGSHDYTIDDIFVPEHRSIEMGKLTSGQLHHDNPFYRMPMAPAFALTVLAPGLGAARGAVARYRERLKTSGPGGGPTDKQIQLATLGTAETQVQVAELITREATRELEHLGGQDTPMTLEDRVRLRTRYAYALDLCRTALRALNDEGGSSAHYLSNPAQRATRDVTTLSTHAIVDKSPTMELQGRISVGLPSNAPWFR